MAPPAATDRLPPGQARTRKFPIVGEKQPTAEALDLAAWRLSVDGLVQRSLTLDYQEILALPQRRLVADIHCVTGWSHLGMRLEGCPLAALLERAVPSGGARFVRFEAFSEHRHDTSLPLDLALRDCWLIHGRNGRPLEPEHGYPLRTVTPSRYFYKSLKWLRRIELLAEDRPGFWERESSYHHRGDPWAGDERFTSGSHPPERIERFMGAADYSPYRGPKKVLIGVDLRGWSPGALDLRDLHVKSCDLRGAALAGADLRGANLSLCDLRGADLRRADLRGADLEGVDFAGADLRRADLRGAALCAARFLGTAEGGGPLAARIDGMLWAVGEDGPLEEQEAFLRSSIGEQPGP